ncbi:cytochrome c peroxidase [Chromatocurvus halotolerans]|uniref:Cytochrome c peroxidase n=1 Tax=Chromatocurvus halotolerans TaxID=1132028 RepID=A0A4R2KNQ1_9GAMM|nr:cytochrome c peroxidase [Chromatocurvus halotolerans]
MPCWRRLLLLAVCAVLVRPIEIARADVTLRERARTHFIAIPEVTPEERHAPQATLGRALFWDPRLSSSGDTACASCHLIEDHGSDRRARSTTARGGRTGFHSMTVFNTQTAGAGLRWLADRPSGKAQALGSITGSMGFDQREDILASLIEHGYRSRFAAAFPDADEPLAVDHYGEALEAYQRTLRTPAPFDAWLTGDDAAMTQTQKSGLRRFMDVGCAGCHNGELLGGQSLQKFGLMADYWAHTGSDEPHHGVMEVSGRDADRDVFRVASLRNVAETAPYFHDASVPTLAQAVRVMSRVQLGRDPDDGATGEIVSFLTSLTGEVPPHFAPPKAFIGGHKP